MVVRQEVRMATLAKTFRLGGDLEVNRLGFGAMRITGSGIWGEPRDPAEARLFYGRTTQLSRSGKSSPYMQGLMFIH